MTQDEAKREAARAALKFLQPGEILGVGTGSTVNQFIELLRPHVADIPAAVSSSEASTARLQALGIRVVDLNEAGTLSLYVDGADEVNRHLQLIKGGGGALTREKIIAGAARTFVCIVDESKQVRALGKFPLPVEVIPMARSYVAREMVKLGGSPELRRGFTTDNGNPILDVHGLEILQPLELESRINRIAGVVTVGLFAHRPADLLIVGAASGIRELKAAG
ncbi:ribose-5-phosphate isomerase RpiA [Panacagrimonas sp.]|uniref:ribose-5-phosphate isomerase RpiA n=1 Tax=Panacagrimonas sp. TaxID=2480088 RepID=UPI003B519F5A